MISQHSLHPAAVAVSGMILVFTLCTVDSVGRNIVEDKGNSIIIAFVHDTVSFLIVEFKGFANLRLIRHTIYHESDPMIGCDRYMDSVTSMKRGMFVDMRLDDIPCR